MVYISLYPPELSPFRVQERVLKGDHAVETKTAVKRYHRSHQELTWFAAKVDHLLVFDNSADHGERRLIFESDPKTIFYRSGVNPEVDKALQAAFGGLQSQGS